MDTECRQYEQRAAAGPAYLDCADRRRRRVAARARRSLGPRDRRHLRDQLPAQAVGGPALRRHRRLPARLPRADRHAQQRAPDGDHAWGSIPSLDTARLVRALRGKPLQWEAASPRFEPEVLESGPIFENVVQGRDVDLRRFPAPLWHEHDGGRYIGTGCRGGHQRSGHRPDQRRRLPHDDPGGRPFGHCQRRSREAGPRAVRSLVREARQGACPRLVRPRSAAADGSGHRGAQHDQRVCVRGRDDRSEARGRARRSHRPADAGLGGDCRGRLDPPGPHVEGRALRRVDRVLLGLAPPGARHRHRAAVFPERPDHPRRAAGQAAQRLLLHAGAAEVGDDPGRTRPRSACATSAVCGRTRPAAAA